MLHKFLLKVREFTRAEKKRLAMAMREKQLGAMGMRTNDKGQVSILLFFKWFKY